VNEFLDLILGLTRASPIIEDMVGNDEAHGYANRENILSRGYQKVSVGVAVAGDTVYLVLDFS